MINQLKAILKKYFSTFFYFYQYLRYRIIITVFLSIFVGILDGFGLTMFLPLLQLVNNESEVNPDQMGKLSFLVEGAESIGISLTLVTVLAIMIMFFVFKGILKYFLNFYRVILEQRFIKTLRLELLNNLNNISFEIFTTSDIGRIQNTMSGEVEKVSYAYRAYFIVYEFAILLIVYIGFAFVVDFQFALLVTAGGILSNYLYKGIYKKTIGASKIFTVESNIYQGRIIQHITNFKYLRATGLADKVGERLKETIVNIEKNRRRIGFLSSIMAAAREPLLITVVAGVIAFQVYGLNGSLGPILISLLFFYRALQSLSSLQNDWNRYLGVTGSLSNMIEYQKFLKTSKENISDYLISKLCNNINLKNVYFAYNENSFISNINLDIPKNKCIAIVGESGSGKTTIINLITGLLKPKKGAIFIDGKDLKDININSYQQRIGYITQEPVIFNDTIYNNVTLWSDPCSENISKFNSAIQKASLSHLIYELPQKEKTLLGNNGINLSGGQKQRISIARELYKDIDVLIMDEATSSLDTETEKAIHESIDELKGDYTILVVAHRLSTVKNADNVVLISKGKIVDQGTFQELIIKQPLFKRMVEMQEI